MIRIRQEKGSVTVFLALTTLLILSFLGSLLELGRFRLLTGEAEDSSQSALRSGLSAYQKELWSTYGIFGVTEEEALQVMNRVLMDQQEGSKGIGNLVVAGQQIQSQERLTDDGKGALSKQVEKRMKILIPITVWEKVKNQYLENGKNMDEKEEKRILEEAEHAQEENRRIQEELMEEGEEPPDVELPEENPIEVMKEWKKKSVFEFLLPEGTKISEFSINPEYQVTGQGLKAGSVSEQTALLLYSKEILYSFVSEKEGRTLRYEQEYVINGRESDRENLKLTLEKLLLLREMIRYTQMLSEPATLEKAASVATALVGASGMPPLILAVQQGVLLAWAFQDAIADTKLLLEGNQVPVLSGVTLNYEEHLSLLLCLVKANTGYERLAAVIGGGIGIPLDSLSTGFTVSFQYEGYPLFQQLVLLPHKEIGTYPIQSIRTDSYFP